jgi:5-methylcytosine-specific restriction endonuclease McrA
MKKTVTKIHTPMELRARCEVDGCDNPVHLSGHSKHTGKELFRKVCGKHHSQRVAEKRGFTNISQVIAANAGFDSVYEYQDFKAREKGFDGVRDELEHRAREKGFDSLTEYNNSRHRYRRNRLDYCQNCAGEAVWVDPDTGEHKPLHDSIGLCTYTIPKGELGMAMLSVDHINGNNQDDRPENHQTLCHNCHKAKSLLSKDHWSCEKKREHLAKMLKLSASSLIFA